MEDKGYCNCCVNRDTDKCSNCYTEDSRGWRRHIEFRPVKEVSKYFSYVGNDEYMWNSTSWEVPPVTKSVDIHNKNYCPYCANLMFPIQNPNTLQVIGYTCFCDGAIAESEYEAGLIRLLPGFASLLFPKFREQFPLLLFSMSRVYSLLLPRFLLATPSSWVLWLCPRVCIHVCVCMCVCLHVCR